MKHSYSYFLLLSLMAACCFLTTPVFAGSWSSELTITHDSIDRTYYVYTPSGMAGDRPVVFVLHGGGGNKNNVRYCSGGARPLCRWRYVADDEKFYVVAPQGIDDHWNDCRSDGDNPDSDDVGFLEALIDWMDSNYNIDLDKIYFAGMSNGGHMSMRMAMESSANVAAIGMICASYPVYSECASPDNPVGVLIMNGVDDPILPYDGGAMAWNRGEVESTDDTITYWKNHNHTDDSYSYHAYSDINDEDGCTVERYTYANGDNNTKVILHKVIDGGHNEPSITEVYSSFYRSVTGNQNWDMESSEEIWDFFSTQSK